MKILRLDTQACDVLRAQLADLLLDAVAGTDARQRVKYAKTPPMPEAA
jgi:hypothetical protein